MRLDDSRLGERVPGPAAETGQAGLDFSTKQASSAEAGNRSYFAANCLSLATRCPRQDRGPGRVQQQVALETAGGELIPIVPDWRGRAFYQDARLPIATSSLSASVKREFPTCKC